MDSPTNTQPAAGFRGVGGPTTKVPFFILRMPKRVTEVEAHRGFGNGEPRECLA
jgi:hypothetical protein